MTIKKIKKWWRSLRYYIVADPYDNSVTLSKRLFQHIKNNAKEGDSACVFMFHIPDNDTFGFMVNPVIEQSTQLCDIQYNDKYKCIGFETLCPSVGKIFYRYGLPFDRRVKISVSVRQNVSNLTYYQLDKPNAKHIRK
jgi:hypothetical protein